MSIVQKAVEVVAKVLPDKDTDPLIGASRVVGKPLSRVDGPVKVTGEAEFTAEVSLPGLAHASLACSTIAAGRIADIDLAAAEAAPGVIFTMTHRNAPKLGDAPMLLDMKGASLSNAPVMQDPSIRWNGEPVAIVVAETKEQADYAASLIRVTYEEESARLAFDPHSAAAHHPKDVFGQPPEEKRGDAAAALSHAAMVVDQIYRTPRHNHCAIEPHATTVEWNDVDRVTIYDATQAVSMTQASFAAVFGLKTEDVRVVSRFVGGAFGNKMGWNHQILCACAASATGRPVRLALSREDVFRTTGGRTLTEQRVALGAKPDGTLAALIHTGVTTTGIDANGFAEQFSFPARHLYAAETSHVDQKILELHMVANASMRAPGESVGAFALESALDELAVKLRLDPIELRRRVEPSEDPSKRTPFSARHLLETFERGAERFGWSERDPKPRSRRDGELWVGQGTATSFYPYQRFPGAKASIRLTRDGRAVVRTAAHEMGMGTATAQVQHAAERLGLPVDHVTFEYGDSDFPTAVPAGGSAQTSSIIGSVVPAAAALFKKLIRLAGNGSPLAGAGLDDVEARDSGLFRRDDGGGETYAAILERADVDHVECEGEGSMPLEMMKYSMASYGAHFCEVRVNDVTGEVRVARWTSVFDTGRVINPKTAASQFRGGIIMGLGSALSEETLFDERTGRIMNPSLAEYHVPVHADVPEIDVSWLDIPDPLAPLGGKGVGEIGIVGVAAAVANAVYNATGKRIRELPLTPDRVLLAPVEA